jgi:cytochrome c5
MWLNRPVHGWLTRRLVFLTLLPVTITGCRASPASSAETKIAYWTKRHITIGGKHKMNPVTATAENIADGQQVFSSYCMVCHGLDGQNTGVPFASTMSPTVYETECGGTG